MSKFQLSKHNEDKTLEIIVEGDGHSVWAYLLDSKHNTIRLDGFVCSQGTVIKSKDEIAPFIEKGFSPPIHNNYLNSLGIRPKIVETDINIQWFKSKGQILLEDEVFAIFNIQDNNFFCKALAKDGPYGHKWP